MCRSVGRSVRLEIYAPVSIVLGLATVALSLLPATLGGDREKGILRRLSTTPVHPRTLVSAHLVVQLVVVSIATVAAILVGMLAFGVPFPESPGWFLVSCALGALALFSVGLLIGAVVPTAASGQAVGMLLYLPLLSFAGVYIPPPGDAGKRSHREQLHTKRGGRPGPLGQLGG